METENPYLPPERESKRKQAAHPKFGLIDFIVGYLIATLIIGVVIALINRHESSSVLFSVFGAPIYCGYGFLVTLYSFVASFSLLYLLKLVLFGGWIWFVSFCFYLCKITAGKARTTSSKGVRPL